MSETPAVAVNGPVSWWEIQVTDLDAAQQFYGSVFGWTFEPFGDGFVVAKTPDGTMIGGLVTVTGDPAGRHVRMYFGTDELEAVLDRVAAAGGTVVEQRTLITEEYGWFATFADPSGIRLGITTVKPAG